GVLGGPWVSSQDTVGCTPHICKGNRVEVWGPSCERVALRGMPRGGLPAGPAGLTARFTRLGLIDREGPALHLLALELGHRRSGGGAIGHLNKAKTFGAAGLAIRNDPDLVHHTIRLEELAEVAVGGAKRQITNINTPHSLYHFSIF